jgi:hypothetical protein
VGLIFTGEILAAWLDRVVRSAEECGPDRSFGVVDFGKDYSLFWSSNLFYNTKNYWFYQVDLIKFGFCIIFFNFKLFQKIKKIRSKIKEFKL